MAVVFTDGGPEHPDQTAAEVVGLRREGIAILVGAMRGVERECGRSMPGSVVFDVDPMNAGSSLHVALNRLRRAGVGASV